ncbi:hypothetical protein Rsub_09536 [Raphidocelis subcapitata]|uniref:Glutamine amidotransferase type-2 domain-containing protein n=1 Tax=Raphidocelis subcapitata TaxID=307507 RepID=A0A2V0PGM5_9CHLO|nr:hypothetical protein Rsub_09536 [Raphidocelis subcapitata]|eukprot:GBF97063.1 hypothetical protein Rsub_09536 [Raphidocelis subcapitata]
MCGILLIAEAANDVNPCHESAQPACDGAAAAAGAVAAAEPAAAVPPPEFAAGLARRGPDGTGARALLIGGSGSCGGHGKGGAGARARCLIAASLLQLRGGARAAAPLVSPRGSVLAFNGEIFGGGVRVPPGANDGAALLAALEAAPPGGVLAVLSSLRGPWALVYWRADARRLWFGRDWLGRRSLLLHLPTPERPRFVLSSSAPLPPGSGTAAAGKAAAYQWQELEPRLYSISGIELADSLATAAAGYTAVTAAAATEVSSAAAEGEATATTATEAAGTAAAAAAVAAAQPAAARQAVDTAGERRPPLANGASANSSNEGGISGSSAASLGGSAAAAGLGLWSRVAHHSWEDESVLRLQSYERPEALIDLTDAACHRAGGGGDAAGAASGEPEQAAAAAAAAEALRSAAARVLEALRASVRARCGAIDRAADGGDGSDGGRDGSSSGPPGPPGPPTLLPAAPVMVLFSGGVDSTLLAALAHAALPPGAPVDLVNVCFDSGASPDRLAARDALAELAAAAPGRAWRLIEVDASLADADAARPRLLALLAPAGVVMDLNIGAALWLAARGEGRLVTPADLAAGGGGSGGEGEGGAAAPPRAPPLVRSAAAVVLLGSGADEQAAGYGRHRTAARLGGARGLAGELASDFRRLWSRNLGRDDRLVSDHGREARAPFLDEGVVAALLGVPLSLLLDARLPLGRGDKMVLREALRSLGLPRAAAREKRAIQFGSRIGRLANLRDFGSGRRANAANAGSVPLAALPWAAEAAGAAAEGAAEAAGAAAP